MTKYRKMCDSDGYQELTILCDTMKEFRSELAWMRRLKLSLSKSNNPLLEFDYNECDTLGYEFRKLHNKGVVRVVYAP